MHEAVSAASSADRHDHDAVAAAGGDSRGTPAASGRFALRVLIVDDDATTGLTLARVLTVQGFEASAVQSGAEGLQRALSGACDVLVLDLHLLDLPGLTVLAELRASGSDLPVVPITGQYLDEEHRRRGGARRLRLPLQAAD